MRIHSSHKIHLSKTALCVGLILLSSRAIDAPLRYFLAKIGASLFIYIPNVLCVLVILLYIIKLINNLHINKYMLIALILFFFITIWGFVNIGTITQVFFGVYVFIPLVIGILSYKNLSEDWDGYTNYFNSLILIISLGVIIGLFIDYPWIGSEIKIGSVTLQASQELSYFDLPRLSGFSRASYDAAIQLLTLMGVVIASKRNIFAKIVTWCMVVLAIIITTTKGAILAVLVMSILFLLPKKTRYFLIPKLILISAIICFLLPTFSVLYDLELRFDSILTNLIFKSFDIRLQTTWPNAMNLINTEGSILLGRGIGGIGTPLMLFEPSRYTAADNFIVHIYGISGFLGISIFFAFMYKFIKNYSFSKNFDVFVMIFTLSALIYGLTGNLLESTYSLFFMGIVLARFFTTTYQE